MGNSRRHRAIKLVFSAAMASCAASALAVPVNATWLGGNSSWANASMWSGGVVPNAGGGFTYGVFIDSGNALPSTVDLNYASNTTTHIDSLTLDANDTLNIENGNRLNIAGGGTIFNAGTINLNSAGAFTNLSVPQVTLSGGGVINMRAGGDNNIRVDSPMARFTNLDNLIRGGGDIGADQAMQLTNHGTIIADVATIQTRIIPGFGSSNINTGWIGANGAQLMMSGSCNLDNSSGIIDATAGSVTLSNRFRITGGTLQTSAGGSIRSQPDGVAVFPRLADLTNRGHVVIPTGCGFEIAGTINNIGSITIGSSTGTLQIAGDTTLTGSGSVELQYLGSIVRGTAVTDRLINEDNTIHGVGSIGIGSMNFTNRGTVLATGGRGIWINASGDATNDTTGLWSAASGGHLVLAGGTFVNNGSINIQAGGSLNVLRPLSGQGVRADGQASIGSVVNIDHVVAGTALVTSSGSLTVNRLNVATLSVLGGNVKINPNGGPTGTSDLGALLLASGQFDLTDNHLIINTGANTLDGLKNFITTGQLMSSLADATHDLGYADNASLNLATFGGAAVDSTSLLVRFTYLGDANLDGQVDINDLASLATNWQAGGSWVNGDFDRNATVDVADLALLATNWQAGVGAPPSMGFEQALATLGMQNIAIPEPGAMAIGFVALAARRRR